MNHGSSCSRLNSFRLPLLIILFQLYLCSVLRAYPKAIVIVGIGLADTVSSCLLKTFSNDWLSG